VCIVNCLFVVVECDALLAEVVHELDVTVQRPKLVPVKETIGVGVERLGHDQHTVLDFEVCHSDVFCTHVVLDCGYSLQDGRRSVNIFQTDFSGNKFHANRLENSSWHEGCWGAEVVPRAWKIPKKTS